MPVLVFAPTTSRSGRQEFERLDVAWTHDGEVPMIERCELWLAQSLGDCQHCGVDESQSQIGVALKQLPDPRVVLVQERFDSERALGAVVQERREGVDVRRRSEQILKFDEHRGRHDAHLAGFFEKLCARAVVLVARLDRRDENARIYDETQGSGS